MVSVTLTQIGEYFAELDRDLEQLARPIVRVSKVTRPSMGSTLTAVSVEAGYVVDGEVIRLRLFAGSLWGVEQTDGDTQDRATALLREIEDGIAERGLQVRAGLYDEIVEGRSSGGGLVDEPDTRRSAPGRRRPAGGPADRPDPAAGGGGS